MFREILISAGLAGLLAALALTVLQALLITPLILQAETYEHAPAAQSPLAAANADADSHAAIAADHEHEHAHTHDHSHNSSDAVQQPGAAVLGTSANANANAAHEHHHDAAEWQPADGLQRTLFTLASNIVMGFAYALLLTGVYVAWRRPTGITQGLLFGLAGFAVFFAAPGIGLPPELPGTAAAELSARQQWWIGTAAATAIGLALLFMQKNIALRGIGVAAIIAPHLLGAPQPELHSSLAPAQLQNHFRWATTLGNAVFWLVLGAISAVAFKKFSTAPAALE